jgi:TATA-box binding protein (TBP) (component of TFIID and TFIIIB)
MYPPCGQLTGKYEENRQRLVRTNGFDDYDAYKEYIRDLKNENELVELTISKGITVLLFDNGHGVLTGATDEYTARLGAALMVRILVQELGIPVSMTRFRVCNVVVTLNLGFKIDLESLYKNEGSSVSYSPETFPSAIIRSQYGRVTGLLNEPGVMIVTGSSDLYELKRFVVRILPVIIKYKIGTDREEEEEEEDRVEKMESESGDSSFFSELSSGEWGKDFSGVMETKRINARESPDSIVATKNENPANEFWNLMCFGDDIVKLIEKACSHQRIDSPSTTSSASVGHTKFERANDQLKNILQNLNVRNTVRDKVGNHHAILFDSIS